MAVAIALAVGTTLGAFAGYFGGVVGDVIMRATDIFASVPNLLLEIVFVAALGANTLNLMIRSASRAFRSLCVSSAASVLKVRIQEYVEAARAIGIGEVASSSAHPDDCFPRLSCRRRCASSAYPASSLSFHGLGVPRRPDGAACCRRTAFLRGYSYMTMFPGLAIESPFLLQTLWVDGLRDALDPNSKSRRTGDD